MAGRGGDCGCDTTSPTFSRYDINSGVGCGGHGGGGEGGEEVEGGGWGGKGGDGLLLGSIVISTK